MQSRFPVYLFGYILIAAGVGWIVAKPERGEVIAVKSGHLPAGIFRVPRIPVAVAAQVLGELPIGDVTPALLASIHERLKSCRRFGPADRGIEDEVRRSLLALLTDGNAATIVKALSPEDLQSEFGVAALSRWAAVDVMAASLWLAQQPVQASEQTWAIAHALADAAVVLDVFCKLLPAGPWREALLEDTCRATLPDNPGNAVLLARYLKPGAVRTKLLLGIADEWASRDALAAVRWIVTEPEVGLRDELFSAAAAARVSTDPDGAFDLALRIASDATFELAINKITSMWIDYAPDESTSRGVIIFPVENNRTGSMRN